MAQVVFVLAANLAGLPAQLFTGTKGHLLIYFGTYSGPNSKGIYVYRLDGNFGSPSQPKLAAEVQNPSFLVLHPSGQFLYAVSETNSSSNGPGHVLAFQIDSSTGSLTALNKQLSAGEEPCHLAIDKAGRYLLVANCGTGSVAAFPINKDGTLGAPTGFLQHPKSSIDPLLSQQGPYAHSVALDCNDRFAIAADLGSDKLLVHRFDPLTGALSPNDPSSASVKLGDGPGHFAFHPQGSHGYVVNDLHSTVTGFDYDPEKGILSETESLSTLPVSFKGPNRAAEVQVHLSGKFLYVSNRGHNSISVFRIDPSTKKLTAVQTRSTGGRTPRSFGIDPNGTSLWVANQDSDNVVIFGIDQNIGRLTEVPPRLSIPSPVSVRFLRVHQE